MPPETPSPYFSNDELLEIIKSAEYEKKVDDHSKSMRDLKHEMQKYLANPTYTRSTKAAPSTGSWDKYVAEQQLVKELEDRIFAKVAAEVRRMTDDYAIKLSALEMAASQHREATERLITALVEQNRELSRRVTDLEWEGINP